ncbi:hypothetical protein [Candidatus Borrarchaeum sp.]|uniref:hypothetical protein n=1 Tax=Candidatus Borrarchaeum sp. TaxID=2846742 RepID=UPI0025798079|nr:hypothetical protein [Candidatus Borrarchaeum sp.]
MNVQAKQKFRWNDVSTLRIIVSILGILVGFAGFEHGFFEILQGNVIPNEFVIDAIGPGQRFWSEGTEPAFTIIPNYFITGILAMSIGLLMIIWAALFIERKYGVRILFLLSITLFLVGGGFAPLPVALLASFVATSINSPLNWWRTHLPENIQNMLVKLWPWNVIVAVFLFLFAVFVAIFGYPIIWFLSAELTVSFNLIIGLIDLGIMVISILSAISYGIQSSPDSN